jgi:putative serine protease PepD
MASVSSSLVPVDDDRGAPTRVRRRRGRLVSAGVLILLPLAGCTGTAQDGQAASGSSATSSSSAPTSGSTTAAGQDGAAVALESAYQHVISSALPSVVEIRSSTGLGSGVVYDDQGDIVTNAHVVGSERQFQVLSSSSAAPLPATLVGVYAANDLAVIKVQGSSGQLPRATFADSTQVRVGDIVLAMGNPLGLSATVTNGIVSAIGRTVTEPVSAESPGATLPNTIQTSAAINPGNSGGALVDLQGQVIGIPTLAALAPQEEGGGAAPGIGFAIPSDDVKRIADQLVATGTVTSSGRAALGVGVTTVTDQSGKPQGVGVVQVAPGGAADKAGIRPGDVIVSVNGQQTPTAQALSALLAGLQVGQTVPVTVQRDGSEQTLQVTLGELGG